MGTEYRIVLINRHVHPLNECFVDLASCGINVLTGDFLFTGYVFGHSIFLVKIVCWRDFLILTMLTHIHTLIYIYTYTNWF